MTLKDIFRLLVSLGIPQIAGGVGAIFSVAAIPSWYASLVRPSLAPPNWVFGPVWTTLFLLMGIALFLVWRKGINVLGGKTALVWFSVQLALNVLWSFLFFGLKSPSFALIEIAILWVSIMATILAFNKISRIAALLLLPYLLWTSFAAYLNALFFVLN
ncbi:MAG: tryptophan-rich sensory protein [Parcubacteria bacterium C7867-001]|nr:MAG: tryptophan-rich sensory protein [Parcubacteria bacterium C7867-001]